jgi:hypothetical protein
VKPVMNNQVVYEEGNFFTSLRTINFSRRAVFRGVLYPQLQAVDYADTPNPAQCKGSFNW